MQIYLVGGAVRDSLLGKPVADRDWVVIGATPEEMLASGYTQVGADFPVFLHPDTHEEYALARTERKTAAGHRGFTTAFSADVTLEEDLARRDLTINAIAQDDDGSYVDPYNGIADLNSKTLRAVTEAFREDPLRILRAARFAAQLPGFAVAAETAEMMRDMCAQGAMDELPGERIWQEFAKVLDAPAPGRFFEVLGDVNGWRPFFAELEQQDLSGADSLSKHQRFAHWCTGLSVEQVVAFCKRIKAPNTYRDFAQQVVRYGSVLGDWHSSDAQNVAQAVQACKGFHKASNLAPLLEYLSVSGYPQARGLLAVVERANEEVQAAQFSEQGPALGRALSNGRAQVISEAQRAR